MRPFTRWIRAWVARCCGARTLARLVDPILSDIDLEYREHVQAGRIWQARGAVLTGYRGLLVALVLHGLHVCVSALVQDVPAKRTMWISVSAFGLITFALVLPPLLGPHIDGILAIYLLPQAIPFSLPIALSIGIACGWSTGTRGRDMLRRVVLLAIAGAMVAATTMEWLIPAANQGFKATIIKRFEESGRAGSLTMRRGINDRSLSELAALVRHTSQTRPFVASEYERVLADLQEINAGMPRSREVTANELQLAFHVRIALCFATAALGLLAVATGSAIRRRSLAGTAFVVLGVLYVYTWFFLEAIVDALPPVVTAWTPNATAAVVSLLLLSIGLPRQAPARFRPE